MPATSKQILDAVQTVVAAAHADLNGTVTIITSDLEDLPSPKGNVLALVKMDTRNVLGFPGGLHFKRHRIAVRLARKLQLDQTQEDEERLTNATDGLLLYDNAVEADLVRNNLSAQIGGGVKLDEPLEMISQSPPRRLKDTGWIVIDHVYECSTCQTVTALIA